MSYDQDYVKILEESVKSSINKTQLETEQYSLPPLVKSILDYGGKNSKEHLTTHTTNGTDGAGKKIATPDASKKPKNEEVEDESGKSLEEENEIQSEDVSPLSVLENDLNDDEFNINEDDKNILNKLMSEIEDLEEEVDQYLEMDEFDDDDDDDDDEITIDIDDDEDEEDDDDYDDLEIDI